MTDISENRMGMGIQVDLGTTDDATVEATIMVVSEDDNAINGLGSGHQVSVFGSVAGDINGIHLGDNPALDKNEHVEVGGDGLVYGIDHGIDMVGSGSSLMNAGIIRGGAIAVIINKPGAGETHINNFGKIIGVATAINLNGGTDEYIIHNTGVIKATQDGGAALDSTTVGATGINLTNDGRMVGDVDLGQGEDIYDGAKGNVSGRINGFDGKDQLTGGKLADMIAGGLGSDTMKGGGGADHFIFTDKNDSAPTPVGRDLITDFSHSQHDKVDLKGIDADEGTVADEKFTFIHSQNFHGTAGELRYAIVDGQTQAAGDTNGDGVADFRIQFDGRIDFVGSDFIL
jgi:hypothetical protein